MHNQLHRFHDSLAARRVTQVLQQLVPNKNFRVEKTEVDDARQEKPGPYVITSDPPPKDSWELNALSRSVDMAIQIALADALRALQPDNPLLTIWHLRPEFRKQVQA